MPDLKLTKEQQDFFYQLNQFFHEIKTDTTNASKSLRSGRQLDTQDYLDQCNIKANEGLIKVKELVSELKNSGLW